MPPAIRKTIENLDHLNGSRRHSHFHSGKTWHFLIKGLVSQDCKVYRLGIFDADLQGLHLEKTEKKTRRKVSSGRYNGCVKVWFLWCGFIERRCIAYIDIGRSAD